MVDTAVTTIDKIRADAGLVRIDFVKADVEGDEFAVLKGATETLERGRPALLLEIEQRHLSKYGVQACEVVAFLSSYGYSMHVRQRRRWHPVGEVTANHRNCLFTMTPPAG